MGGVIPHKAGLCYKNLCNVTMFQMDSFAMFEDNYPSADNQVSGIVALLAAAEAIGMVKEDIDQGDKDIMFTFFQGVS